MMFVSQAQRSRYKEKAMDKNREMKVSITGESQNPTKITLKSGKFSMIIDEPKEMGGTDEGPSPIQVLLMSLAGCLNVTGHEIAREKGLDVTWE